MENKDYIKDYLYWVELIHSEKELIDIFMEKVRQKFKEDETELILVCFNYMKRKHEGQMRRENVPYYTHPLTCSLFTLDYTDDNNRFEVFIAALLHDVLEDTDTPYSELRRKFGDNVSHLVELMSKQIEGVKKDKFGEYYPNLKEDIRGVILKVCDRLANLHSLYYEKEKNKFNEYIDKTYNEIIPLSETLTEGKEKLMVILKYLKATRFND